MGKGAKRKSGVGIDFSKAKYKVGRKVAKTQNDTDVNFKSRSIALPSQGVGAAKGTTAVTSKNLTIKELFSQVGHYNERMRKDALMGLLELLTQHPNECQRHTATIIDKLTGRLVDSSSAVRSAARDLLTRGLLPAMGPDALAPFVPMLYAHCAAALTHVSEGVRVDGLAVVEALSGALPPALLAPHLAGCVRGYGELMVYGAQARGTQMRPLKSVHKVVSSLKRLLAALVAARRDEDARAVEAARVAAVVGGVLGRARGVPPPPRSSQALAAMLAALDAAGGGAGPHALQAHAGLRVELFLQGSELGGAGAQGTADHEGELRGALTSLNSRLLGIWAECCPSQLAANPELLPVQCMAAVMHCAAFAVALLHTGDNAGDDSGVGAAARVVEGWRVKVSPHLPVQLHQGAAPQLAQAMGSLNRAAAVLLGERRRRA